MASSVTATLIVSIQALVLVPIYLHYVGPKLYGAWVASGDLFFYLNTLEFGIPNLMIQRIGASVGKGDLPAVGRWTASGLLMLIASGGILSALCIFLSPHLAGWFKLDGEAAATLAPCFLLAGVAAALNLANQAFVALARGLQDTVYQNVAVVVSAVVGFLVALVSVMHGAGLYSIPASLLARSLTSVAFSIAFWYRHVPQVIRNHFGPDRTTFRSIFQLSPLTALGTLGYTTGTQSENLLIGLILGPAAVVPLTVTRRGADVLRNMIDMMTHASFGAFSHLFASPERTKAPSVYHELTHLRASIAVVAAAGYMSLNHIFVKIWVGEAYYAGWAVTALIALNFLLSGQSYLVNSLYRATGHITTGAVLLICEAACRVPLAALGAAHIGLAGPQAAGIVTSIGSLTIASMLCRRVWRQMNISITRKLFPQFVLYAAIMALSLACCFVAKAEIGKGPLVLGWTVLATLSLVALWAQPSIKSVVPSLLRRRELSL